MSSLSSAASSKTPPAAYPSCHLCRRTRPLPTFNLDTLDPLPSEIRSLIWDFVISTRCRSAMVKLLCISAQLYEQIAPQLYSSVVLDERTTEGLYYGLWKREGETGDTLPGIGDEQEAKESGKAAWARLEANLCVIDTIHGPSTPDNPPPWTEAEAQIVLRRFTTPPMTASPFLRQPVRKLALFNLVCTLSIGDEVGMHLIGTANRMQADIHMRPVWFERLQVGVRLGNDDADVQAVRGRGTLRNGATFGHYDNLFEPRCMIYLGCNTNEQEVEAGVNQRLDGDRQRWDEAVARRAIGYDDGNHQPNSYKY
ncbi:hypothetical protein IAT38_004854 [Cryptococcus sp. DSM 104549]